MHTRLWRAGVEAVGIYGALPALAISRHGAAIYELTFDIETARPEQTDAQRAFVPRQTEFGNLRSQSSSSKFSRAARIARFTVDHWPFTVGVLVVEIEGKRPMPARDGMFRDAETVFEKAALVFV